MKKAFNCRRSFVGLVGIMCLLILGFFKGAEVAAAITTITLGIAAANATQGIMGKKDE